jgi:hypothetical protein
MLHTIYYTKLFTSGNLKGIVVHQKISTSFPDDFRKGKTGKDLFTKDKWIIVDASYQNYIRN